MTRKEPKDDGRRTTTGAGAQVPPGGNDDHLFALIERDKRLSATWGNIDDALALAKQAGTSTAALKDKDNTTTAELRDLATAIRETPAQTVQGVLAKLEWAGPADSPPDDEETVESARADLRRIVERMS